MLKSIYISLKKHEVLWVSVLTAVSFMLYLLLSCYDKQIFVYPDELRYLSIARSLANGQGLRIYNLPSDYQKILYSVFLIPAVSYFDVTMQARAIAVTNSILIASGVIPVYLLTKKYVKSPAYRIIDCIIYTVSSDVAFTFSFMSENLYIPLGIWTVYALSAVLDKMDACGPERMHFSKKEVILFIFSGLMIFLLYLCKEVASAFLIALALYPFGKIFKEAVVRSSEKKKGNKAELSSEKGKRASFNNQINSHQLKALLLVLIGFAIPFLLLKLTLFRGLGNSYDQQDPYVLINVFNFYYIFYAFVYFLLMTVLGFTLPPFLIPLYNRKNLSNSARHAFYYLLMVLIILAGAVAYTITVREDWGETLPRVHLRYVSCLFLPFVVMMTASIEARSSNIKSKKWILAFPAILLCWFAYYLLLPEHKISTDICVFDNTQLRLLTSLSSEGQAIFLLIYAIVLLTIFYQYYRKKKYASIAFAFLIIFNILNLVNVSKEYRVNNKIDPQYANDVLELGEFIADHPDDQFVFICINNGWDGTFDTYINSSNVAWLRYEDFFQYANSADDKSWVSASKKIRTIRFDQYYCLKNVDYIIWRDDGFMNIYSRDYGNELQNAFSTTDADLSEEDIHLLEFDTDETEKVFRSENNSLLMVKVKDPSKIPDLNFSSKIDTIIMDVTGNSAETQ